MCLLRLHAQDSSFYMWELPMFALIATLGGLLGAGFVACSKRMALFRARHLAGAKRRFIEASEKFHQDRQTFLHDIHMA